MSTDEELERKTDEIAKRLGCDRAVFTVCWAETEAGLLCECKEEAKRQIASAHHTQ
jgi:hypothetical protein